MKAKLCIVAVWALIAVGAAQADSIFGAGATFPNAVYQAWGKAYQSQTQQKLIYTPVGSGKGITEILAARTDFGASDKPMTLDELEKNKLMQFPLVIGGVVPTINIKGIADGRLLLDGGTLAAIFLGKISRWNDPAVLALNPGLALPNAEIVVIHRTDKSGTTFNFSNYLSKVSPEWKASIGEGLAVQWPVGEAVEKSDGMAKKIAETPNSIGYLDLADIQKKGLASTRMKNREGVAVSAGEASFAAAAAAAKWSAATGYYEILTNQAGKESWPITAATFILLERTPTLLEHTREALKFFDWAYRNGDELANGLHYVPLPDSVADGVRAAWHQQIKDKMGKAVW
ncbi:MAG: phosphate-binding protein PstS [Pseudomonadota bacterium]